MGSEELPGVDGFGVGLDQLELALRDGAFELGPQ
jgi:hypothetical protein